MGPQNRGPIPSGCGGHSRLLPLQIAARVLAACRNRSNQFVMHFAIQIATIKGEQPCPS
jgi:hypothetical protein